MSFKQETFVLPSGQNLKTPYPSKMASYLPHNAKEALDRIRDSFSTQQVCQHCNQLEFEEFATSAKNVGCLQENKSRTNRTPQAAGKDTLPKTATPKYAQKHTDWNFEVWSPRSVAVDA